MPTEPPSKPGSQPAEKSANPAQGPTPGPSGGLGAGASRKSGGKPAPAGGARLDADAIADRMKSLPDWTQSGEALQRTLRFPDFVTAMEFVDRIAEIAEQQGHHPDILIRYNKVTLTLSTHDAGGITAKDFTLAEAIEKIVPR